MKTSLLIMLLWSITFQMLFAQKETKPLLQTHFAYGFYLPFANLSNDFASHSALNISVDYMSPRQFIFGTEGSFFFGDVVKNDVLATLRTAEGFIVGNDRNVADIQLRQRGNYIGLYGGQLFSLTEKNKRSGIRATLGLGLLQHKIRIQDDPQRVVPQLSAEYKKGYDRLTNGLAIHPFLGYQHIDKSNGFDFVAGISYIHASTQNRRSLNFDTQQKDTRQRTDIVLGFRLAFSLTFVLDPSTSEIIY